MVRSVTVFDEDFTAEDMAAALDWKHQDALLCNGCGHPLDETMDPAREYDAEVVVCRGCAQGEQKMKAFRSSQNADTAGTRTRVWEIEG